MGDPRLTDRSSPQNSSGSRGSSPYKPLLSRRESSSAIGKRSNYTELRTTLPLSTVAPQPIQKIVNTSHFQSNQPSIERLQRPRVPFGPPSPVQSSVPFSSIPGSNPHTSSHIPPHRENYNPSLGSSAQLPAPHSGARSPPLPKSQPAASSLLESLRRETNFLKRQVQTCVEEYTQAKEMNRLLLKKIFILSEISLK